VKNVLFVLEVSLSTFCTTKNLKNAKKMRLGMNSVWGIVGFCCIYNENTWI